MLCEPFVIISDITNHDELRLPTQLSVPGDHPPSLHPQLHQVIHYTIHLPKSRSPYCPSFQSEIWCFWVFHCDPFFVNALPIIAGPLQLFLLFPMTISACTILGLCPFLHSPFSCIGPYTLIIFLLELHSHNLSDNVNVHVLLQYIRMGIVGFLYIITFVSWVSRHDIKHFCSP